MTLSLVSRFVRQVSACALTLLLFVCPAEGADEQIPTNEEPSRENAADKLDTGSNHALSLVVMDPLAAPLSCPCVEGYAQRKYEVLGEYLSQRLGRPVVITFAESLQNALAKENVDDVHLVIGKDSVVRAQGKKQQLEMTRLARLVGKDGKTTQTGLIVVRQADPATALVDLTGYRLIFGPPDCDEKFAAARTLLESADVALAPEQDAEISHACSDGACTIIDWGEKIRGAAVISSYAAPLLEGCGTIKKGDLRVLAETKPVPFIAAFATHLLDKDEQHRVQQALYDARKAPGMLLALETLLGFVPEDFKAVENLAPDDPARDKPLTLPPQSKGAAKALQRPTAPASPTAQAWPGWLGPLRNGRVAWLPDKLPEKLQVVWKRPFLRAGMGGLAGTDRHLFVGDRDAANRADVFRCLDAASGDELWSVIQPTLGQLDYDNLPRATPLVVQDRVLFLGAFGDLICVESATGDVAWRTNIRLKFLAFDKLPWGTCSSPLLVDDMIIVNPGAPMASVVALDLATGNVRWQTPGQPQGYGSLIEATLGGVRQIVGHTQSKLCGWEARSGRELWALQPRAQGDFNVPTPVVVGEQLLVATENNGARLYRFDQRGVIIPEHVADNARFNPQMSTPVVVGDRIFCVNNRLECFSVRNGLKSLGALRERSFGEFGAALATNERVLVQGLGGELILVDATSDQPRIVSRLAVTLDDDASKAELYTFPALVDTRLFLRGESEVLCVDLGPQQN